MVTYKTAPAKEDKRIPSKVVDVRYYEQNDILYLTVIPPRPARYRVVDDDFCFMAAIHTENNQDVVGFEIHYFSLQDPDWLEAPEFAPYLTQRYYVVDSPIKDGTLPEIFAWARERFLTR